MKNKRVVVLLKFFKGELNPFDGAALETALQSGAKEIVALTMSPASVAEQSVRRRGHDCHFSRFSRSCQTARSRFYLLRSAKRGRGYRASTAYACSKTWISLDGEDNGNGRRYRQDPKR